MLPHQREKKKEEEPFETMDREIARVFKDVHPEADPQYYTPTTVSSVTPAHNTPNTELDKAAEKSDDKDADGS